MSDDHDAFFHNYNNNIRDIPIQKGQFGDNYDNAYIQLYWYSAHRAGKTILIISSFFFTGGGGEFVWLRKYVKIIDILFFFLSLFFSFFSIFYSLLYCLIKKQNKKS